MSNKIKTSILLIVSLTIVVLTILALGSDTLHAFEDIFYDKVSNVFTRSALSKLTNILNLCIATISLFFVPVYIIKLVDKDYKINRIFYSLKFIASILLIVVIALVVFVFFPIVCVTENVKVAVDSMFLGDCLFTHIISPFLFIGSYFLLDEKTDLGKKEIIAVDVVIFIYVFVYSQFVFIFKTWEDFYFIKQVIKHATIFSVIVAVIASLIGTHFLGKFLAKKKSIIQPETEKGKI